MNSKITEEEEEKKKKSTMVEADVQPASSLSNGIDDVPQYFHL